MSKDGCVNSVMFSANGQLMVSGGDDGVLRLWGVSGGKGEGQWEEKLIA